MDALFMEHFPTFVLEQAEERGFQASVLQPLSSNFGHDLTGDPSLLLSDDFPPAPGTYVSAKQDAPDDDDSIERRALQLELDFYGNLDSKL
jgi:hypothetical protein